MLRNDTRNDALESDVLRRRRAALLRREHAGSSSAYVTLPYALDLANKGFETAIQGDVGLREGVNTYAGKLTYAAVAESQGLEYTPLDSVLDLKAASAS